MKSTIPEPLDPNWLLEATRSKNGVQQLASIMDVQVGELLDLCYHRDKQVAFRASWVLEEVAENHPAHFIPVAPAFLRKIHLQNNLSCRRHFSKILLFLSGKNASESYQELIQNADRKYLVEAIFDWLIDPKTPVAVAVNCLDILYNFRREFDWIEDELRAQLALRINQGSPAMDSRAKRILHRLERTARN